MNNVKLTYPSDRTKAGEIMNGFKPLIDVNAPRRSKMVAAYRWFQVIIVLAFIGGLLYRGLL